MPSIFAKHIRNHTKAIGHLTELQLRIEETGSLISNCLQRGGKILLCGNGGSAADAQHISAELVGRFVAERKALSAIALTTDTSILTAVANDYGYQQLFARQVEALAREEDILISISTSGNSENVLAAVEAAKKINCTTIGLLGRDGGKLKSAVEYPLVVPVGTTAHIQECHIVIGHLWCAMVDTELLKSVT